MFFASEERSSDSPFVHQIWQVQSEQSGSFMSRAVIHWEMVLSLGESGVVFTVRGPETHATQAIVPSGGEWLGITFKLGTFMPNFPPSMLIDRQDVNLPEATGKSFWLDGSAWEYPTYENADTFVNCLVRAGLIVRDPLVDEVMRDYPLNLTPRAMQYRFQRATGLTQKAVRQIERARQAAELLEQGLSIPDTAHQLGYFDQSHLTNSLRRYIGQTPAQVARTLQPA